MPAAAVKKPTALERYDAEIEATERALADTQEALPGSLGMTRNDLLAKEDQLLAALENLRANRANVAKREEASAQKAEQEAAWQELADARAKAATKYNEYRAAFAESLAELNRLDMEHRGRCHKPMLAAAISPRLALLFELAPLATGALMPREIQQGGGL